MEEINTQKHRAFIEKSTKDLVVTLYETVNNNNEINNEEKTIIALEILANTVINSFLFSENDLSTLQEFCETCLAGFNYFKNTYPDVYKKDNIN